MHHTSRRCRVAMIIHTLTADLRIIEYLLRHSVSTHATKVRTAIFAIVTFIFQVERRSKRAGDLSGLKTGRSASAHPSSCRHS